MLLRNESKILYSVSVDLFFDDETEKHVSLKVGDLATLTYAESGSKLTRTGKITKIVPLIKNRILNPDQVCHCHYNTNESAILVVDYGKEYQSGTIAVRLEDILDITTPQIPENTISGDTTGIV